MNSAAFHLAPAYAGRMFNSCDCAGGFVMDGYGDLGELWQPVNRDFVFPEMSWTSYVVYGEYCFEPNEVTRDVGPTVLLGAGPGVHRNTNYGTPGDWQYINFNDTLDLNRSWMGPKCFVWKKHSNIVLAGRGNFGNARGPLMEQILKSENGGEDWAVINNDDCDFPVTPDPDEGIAVFSLVKDPARRSNRIYASTTAGIFKSDNWGTSWSWFDPQPPCDPSLIRKMSVARQMRGNKNYYYFITTDRVPTGDINPTRVYRYVSGDSEWEVVLEKTNTEIGYDQSTRFMWIAQNQTKPEKILVGLYGWTPNNEVVWRSTNATAPVMDVEFEVIADPSNISTDHWLTPNGLSAHHLALDPVSNRAMFGGNTSYLSTGSVWAETVTWEDRSSFIGQTTSEWEGRGLEIMGVNDLCHSGTTVWAAYSDFRAWKNANGPELNGSWLLVDSPFNPSSDWYDPWGSNHQGLIEGSVGCDAISIVSDPVDPTRIFAAASNYVYSPPFSRWAKPFDDEQDNPFFSYTGAALVGDAESNSGWIEFDYDTPPQGEGPLERSQWGTAPHLFLDDAAGILHAAVHGKGYFAHSAYSPGEGWDPVSYDPEAEVEEWCYAVVGYETGQPDPNDYRVILGHSSANKWYSDNNSAPPDDFTPPAGSGTNLNDWNSKGLDIPDDGVGGIWYGNPWEGPAMAQATTPVGRHQDVLCLERVPGTDIVFAGCWDQRRDSGDLRDGILISTNGGATWDPCIFHGGSPTPRRVVDIKVHPNNPDYVFAAAAATSAGDDGAGLWYAARDEEAPYYGDWYLCNVSGIGSYRFSSMDILPGPWPGGTMLLGTYCNGLWAGAIELDGTPRFVRADDASGLGYQMASMTVLGPNGGGTRIMLDIPYGAGPVPVSLRVHDLAGRLVGTLSNGSLEPGRHEFSWPGGVSAHHPSGAYICRVEMPGFRQSKRLVIVR